MAKTKLHHTLSELNEIAKKQLTRIRAGKRMETLEGLPRSDKPQVERRWKEGGGAPHKLTDVSV